MRAEDRLRLIDEIWDSLSPTDQLEIPQSHREELDRRLAAATLIHPRAHPGRKCERGYDLISEKSPGNYIVKT